MTAKRLGLFYFIIISVVSVLLVVITLPDTTTETDFILKELSDSKSLLPSRLTRIEKNKVNKIFDKLSNDIKGTFRLRLLVRHVTRGPDASAFPCGTILVSDEIIENTESDDEIAGVLAHEIGHVVKKHAEKIFLQSLLDLLFSASTVFSIVTFTPVLAMDKNIGEILWDLPLPFYSNNYARQQEIEADKFSVLLLKKKGYKPDGVAINIIRNKNMETLSYYSKPEYLATHPLPEIRINSIRNFVKQLNNKSESIQLESFNKLLRGKE